MRVRDLDDRTARLRAVAEGLRHRRPAPWQARVIFELGGADGVGLGDSREARGVVEALAVLRRSLRPSEWGRWADRWGPLPGWWPGSPGYLWGAAGGLCSRQTRDAVWGAPPHELKRVAIEAAARTITPEPAHEVAELVWGMAWW